MTRRRLERDLTLQGLRPVFDAREGRTELRIPSPTPSVPSLGEPSKVGEEDNNQPVAKQAVSAPVQHGKLHGTTRKLTDISLCGDWTLWGHKSSPQAQRRASDSFMTRPGPLPLELPTPMRFGASIPSGRESYRTLPVCSSPRLPGPSLLTSSNQSPPASQPQEQVTRHSLEFRR